MNMAGFPAQEYLACTILKTFFLCFIVVDFIVAEEPAM